MERNRWETALRCLEVALHPNTGDDELIAAVNGFRRTAAGTPLRDVCAVLAAGEGDGRAVSAEAARWRAKLERLHRENLALRRRLKDEERSRAEAERRAEAAAQQLHALREEAAAAPRAPGAATGAADLRGGYAERGEAARRSFTPRPPAAAPASPKAPFQRLLDAAREQPWTA